MSRRADGRAGQPASIKHVAAHAGVSVGTVSNVLNRPDEVGAETRARVQRAIAELGFVRNEQARALRVGSSRVVAFVCLDVANPFFTDVGAGAEGVAEEHGSMLALCNSGEDVHHQARHLAELGEQRVQGVLLTPAEEDDPALDALLARGVPVVLVDRMAGPGQRCSVAVDDVEGGRLALRHLLERGHRRIAFVGGPTGLRQVADRRAGAAAAVDDDGDALLVDVPVSSLTVAAGRTAGELLAALPPGDRPTAAFCANDLVALGVLQALTGAGLRVPHDVALVGYDDILYAEAAAVPLSSVRQPREALGRTAAELLFDEIAGNDGHTHRQVVFQPDLVVRASSAAARG